MFINQGTVTVENLTQPKNVLGNIQRIRDIINHPSIHVTLIISVMNVMAGDQICASDVDWRIISLHIFQNQKLQIINFTGTYKSIKLVHRRVYLL